MFRRACIGGFLRLVRMEVRIDEHTLLVSEDMAHLKQGWECVKSKAYAHVWQRDVLVWTSRGESTAEGELLVGLWLLRSTGAGVYQNRMVR